MDRLPEESTGVIELQGDPPEPRKSLRERWQNWLGPWRTYFWIFIVVVSVGDRLIHPEKPWLGLPDLSALTWTQAKPFLVLLVVESLILLAVGYAIGWLESLRWHTAFKVTLLMLLLLATTAVMLLAAVAVFEIMLR